MPPKQRKGEKKGGNIGKHNAAARKDVGEVASPPSFEFAKGNNFGNDFKVVNIWCGPNARADKGEREKGEGSGRGEREKLSRGRS